MEQIKVALVDEAMIGIREVAEVLTTDVESAQACDQVRAGRIGKCLNTSGLPDFPHDITTRLGNLEGVVAASVGRGGGNNLSCDEIE